MTAKNRRSWVLIFAVSGFMVAAREVPIGQGERADSLEFDVVSVKPNRSSSGNTSQRIRPSLSFENVTARTLIMLAYDVQAFLLIGGPDWANKEKFDFVASNPPGTNPTVAQIRAMTRIALAGRFALRVHKEPRLQEVFWLTTANSDKSRLKAAPVNCSSDETPRAVRTKPGTCALQYSRDRVSAHGYGLDVITRLVSTTYRKPVIDKTKLTGGFDFELSWNQRESPESPLPSLETALREQLGLKLESHEGTVETVVIDQLQRPSPD